MKKIFPCLLFFLMIFGRILVAQNTIVNDTTIYNVVDKMPVFPGNLQDYMGLHLHYPESALENNVQGTVYLSFIVSQTGMVKDVKVDKGISPDLDTAAVEVVRGMPQWNPGIEKGTSANVRLHLPIKCSISKNLNNPVYTVDKKIDITTRKGFYVAPYLGLQFGSVALKQEQPVNPMGGGPLSPFKFNGSIEIGYMFNNHIGMFIAPQYISFANNYSFDAPFAGNLQMEGYTDYSFSNLEVPLLFKYITSQPGKLGLEVGAGFNYEILTNGSENGSLKEIGIYQNQITVYEAENFTNVANVYKSNWGVTINIALNIPLTNVLSMSVGAMWSYELQSVGNGENDFVGLGYYGSTFSYYQGEYGTANSYLLFSKLIIRLGKKTVKSTEAK
jgi:TonB family protein